MRKASYNDKDTVVEILSTSFINDPHVNWLIEESKNKNKLKILIEYVFGESLDRGEIYLSDDNKAAVLWNTEKKGKVSFEFIKRNLQFLFQVGLKSTIRALKTDKIIYNFYPKKQPYCQLYLIGVLPDGQGKGLASSLMNPMIENMKTRAIPMHLETANPRNVEIYRKKGFSIINTMQFGKNTLYWMRR
jgi:ribosomal protein S18 acetylase RimI-like enzyme